MIILSTPGPSSPQPSDRQEKTSEGMTASVRQMSAPGPVAPHNPAAQRQWFPETHNSYPAPLREAQVFPANSSQCLSTRMLWERAGLRETWNPPQNDPGSLHITSPELTRSNIFCSSPIFQTDRLSLSFCLSPLQTQQKHQEM